MTAPTLDERALCDALAPRLDDPVFRVGLANLARDPFFLAFFLVSVSQGEGLGEGAVAMIGREELASRIRDLERQRVEEQGHKEQTLDAARALFPQFFDAGRYRYEGALEGRSYYVTVLEANRERLRRDGRYSRLNLYLTTTFGYEVMVALLYRAVADAVAASALASPARERVVAVLERILAEEETHLGVLGQHAALLDAPRAELAPESVALVEQLEGLGSADYRFAAELAVDQVVAMLRHYADAPAWRAHIEASAA